MEVALEYFIVRVRQRHKTKFNPLDNLDGAGASLLKILEKAVEPLVQGNHKGVPGKSLSIMKLKKSDVGFSGLLMVGEYGVSSPVIDVTDGSQAFQKMKNHAEQLPYYFRLHIPKVGDRGVLILQRSGVSGITTILRNILRGYFSSIFSDLTLDISPMVPDFLFKRYLNKGTPKSVSFIKNTIPADLADKVSGKHQDTKGSVEVIIKSPSPAFFQPKKLLEAKTPNAIASVYTFDDFQPDKVKLKVDVGGKTRTINLNNHANLRASFDVTEDVNEDSNGHPHLGDVESAAQKILEEVAEAAGINL